MLRLIVSASHIITYVGVLSTVALSGSDDGIIEGLEKIDDNAELEEVIETTTDNVETVLKNQKRMYAIHSKHHQELKSLFFKGIGVLVTLMTAMIGLVGAVLVL